MGILVSLKNIQIALQFIITLFFVFFGIRFYGAIVALVISTFCVGLLGILYLYKKGLLHKRRKEKIEWAFTSLIIKRGFFYSLNSIISNTKNYFFILTLTLFSFFSEVSYLKAAVSVSSIFYLILRPIRLSVTPMFTRLSWDKPEERKNLIQVFHYSLKFSILFITPVVFYSVFFASKLIPVFFGSNYSASSQFISTFLISFFPLAFGMNVIPPFFFGQKKPRLAFHIEFLSFVFSISLAILFSLIFQSNGYAFGISLGAILGLIFGLFLLKKKFGRTLLSEGRQISLTILISGVLSFIMLLGYLLVEKFIVLNNEFMILLICGLAFILYYFSYFLVLIRINLINYTEIKFFMQEFQKIPLLNKFLPTLIKVANFFIRIR